MSDAIRSALDIANREIKRASGAACDHRRFVVERLSPNPEQESDVRCSDCGVGGKALVRYGTALDFHAREAMDDDAADIPPALSASEWNVLEAKRRNGELEISVAKYGDELAKLYVWDSQVDPGASTQVDDANDVAAVIALSNELLRRFDDPRAFTREHVELLRDLANRIGEESISYRVEASDPEKLGISAADLAPDFRQIDLLNDLADALESYLPPRAQRTIDKVDNRDPNDPSRETFIVDER
jgi:hypothetical protein